MLNESNFPKWLQEVHPQSHYGIGYVGSKSRIAPDLFSVLPHGKRFVDLFCGGLAMTHYAITEGKFSSALSYDIEPRIVALCRNAITGYYNPQHFKFEWCDRKEFFEKNETDPFIRYVWSFGNKGDTYAFGRNNEDIYHKEFDNRLNGQEKKSSLRLHVIARYKRIVLLENLKEANILIENKSYKDYTYKKGDIVYCDIPYNNTTNPYGSFDTKGFYDWAAAQSYPVYFSSYDHIGKVLWQKKILTSLSGFKTKSTRTETL